MSPDPTFTRLVIAAAVYAVALTLFVGVIGTRLRRERDEARWDEREACAKVADDLFNGFASPWEYQDDVARAIRARGGSVPQIHTVPAGSACALCREGEPHVHERASGAVE